MDAEGGEVGGGSSKKLDLCSKETTKNVESRSKEFNTRVLLVTQTAEMVGQYGKGGCQWRCES